MDTRPTDTPGFTPRITVNGRRFNGWWNDEYGNRIFVVNGIPVYFYRGKS